MAIARSVAHALYRHGGRLVSLFIFPGRRQPRRANLEIMGQRELIWSQGGRSYAVVGRRRRRADRFVDALKAFFSRKL